MVKSHIFLTFIFIISACSCSKTLEDDLLTIERISNNNSSLRLDGYYFTEFESDEPRLSIYFLYQNGIILSGASPPVSEIEQREIEYQNGNFYETVKEVKFQWGVYLIEGNVISFEKWYPSEKPYKVFLRTDEVLNDTTFRITQLSKPDGSEVEQIDELYHFKALSPKPDSTNTFIE